MRLDNRSLHYRIVNLENKINTGIVNAAHDTTSTVVSDTAVTADSKIFLTATNAIAAGLTGVYVSSTSVGVSFTVTHSDPGGTNHGLFDYLIVD